MQILLRSKRIAPQRFFTAINAQLLTRWIHKVVRVALADGAIAGYDFPLWKRWGEGDSVGYGAAVATGRVEMDICGVEGG